MPSFLCEKLFQPQDDPRCTMIATVRCGSCETYACASCYIAYHKEHDLFRLRAVR